jgi:hypothetical protein
MHGRHLGPTPRRTAAIRRGHSYPSSLYSHQGRYQPYRRHSMPTDPGSA